MITTDNNEKLEDFLVSLEQVKETIKNEEKRLLLLKIFETTLKITQTEIRVFQFRLRLAKIINEIIPYKQDIKNMLNLAISDTLKGTKEQKEALKILKFCLKKKDDFQNADFVESFYLSYLAVVFLYKNDIKQINMILKIWHMALRNLTMVLDFEEIGQQQEELKKILMANLPTLRK